MAASRFLITLYSSGKDQISIRSNPGENLDLSLNACKACACCYKMNMISFLYRFLRKKQNHLMFVFPHSCLLLGFPFNSQCDCHENELLICFPKEFLMPHRSDSLSEMVVVWSTNNFPGLHCLSKAFFHPALIMWKMPLSKVPLPFFSHKDVRWRKLEFPNMLICLSVNSTPSSTVLESSFSIFEISCAWVTQVCLWVKMQYVL